MKPGIMLFNISLKHIIIVNVFIEAKLTMICGSLNYDDQFVFCNAIFCNKNFFDEGFEWYIYLRHGKFLEYSTKF